MCIRDSITSFNDVIQYQGFVDDRDVSAQNMNSAVCQTLSVDHYTPAPQTIVTSLTYNSYNIIISVFISVLCFLSYSAHIYFIFTVSGVTVLYWSN